MGIDRELQDSQQEFEMSEQKRVEDEMVAATIRESEGDVQSIENEILASVMHQSAQDSPGIAEYPAAVVSVMLMGFPPEKVVQAYDLVGDNEEMMIQYLMQNLPLH